MAKKLSLLVAACAAIMAFAVPTAANAASATCGTSTLCPVGTVVTGTGTNVELQTELVGNLKCTGLNLKGKITQNVLNGVLKAAGAAEKPTQSGCTSSNGGTIVVEEVTLTNLEAKESDGPSGTKKNGVVSFVAKVKLPSGGICTFTGTNVPGTFISTASPAVLTSADPAKDIPSTGGCGKAKLVGSFSLAYSGGAVVLH